MMLRIPNQNIENMENIYQQTLELVQKGARFNVNLEGRTLKVNRRYVIRCGKYEGNLGVPQMPIEDVLSKIEEFYDVYKHSVPSERSDNKRKLYFRALKLDDLDSDDVLFGMPRELARAQLELFLLCCILNGSIKWEENFGNHWFWQSEKDRWLVIRKDMIEPTPRKGEAA